MAILLALGSALAYGLSDFVGGLLARRTSAWAVAVVGQSSSAGCVTLLALAGTGSPTPGDFAWTTVAGIASGLGAAFLYRGFATGQMAVVAPVSAVGAALVPVLAGAAGGERPAWPVWLGILMALPGIWLVSSTPSVPGERASVAAGAVDGTLAGLGFGVLFAALGQVRASAGWWPLAWAQLVGVLAIVVLATVLRVAWVPREPAARRAVVMGPLGAGATGLFLVATHHGYLTVAGVLAALYPASTVMLAAALLHERVRRIQTAGLVLCAVAVALVAGA